MSPLLDRLYSDLVESDDDHGRGDLPDSVAKAVPGNAARLVGGFTLQKIGDRIADPKTVLAWLLTALGAPAATTALLVPVRESGALLPQALLVPWVRRFGLRSRVWATGAVGQAVAVGAIGLAALTLTGLGLAVTVLICLGVFSLARAVSSISAKDVIGKTIPFDNRGSVTGIAASVAGLAAITAGVVMTTAMADAAPEALAVVVVGSALLWLGGGGIFLTVDEKPSARDTSDAATSFRDSIRLLTGDRDFRRFVIARSLMLVTALSPPYVVALSASVGETSVSGVGPFVVATGIAGLVASPIWGRLADHSARLVMASASGVGALVILGYLAAGQAGLDTTTWLGPATYLLLALAHAGARMGRKTYVVDMAGDERRTRYVGVSNTIIGLVLLATGLLGAVAARFGAEWTLAGLAIAGLGGAAVSMSMKEIQAD